MYEINILVKRMITINVLREMISKIIILPTYELFTVTR
jgi:hypothetical protein